MALARSDNSSGYTGVARVEGNSPEKQWRARMWVTTAAGPRCITVGSFPSARIAYEAYKEAKKRYGRAIQRHNLDHLARRLFSKTLTVKELKNNRGLTPVEIRNVCVIYCNLRGIRTPAAASRTNELFN